MNSREIQLIECLVSDDKRVMNNAMEKMFFAPKGQMMSPFQKAAFDAIQRKFNGTRYARFSVREKYETAMSSGVIDKLIDVLKRDRTSFMEQRKTNPELNAPGIHWTSQYKNINAYLGIIVEREVNKNRAIIDAILGLDPECFSSVSLDDKLKLSDEEESGHDAIQKDGSSFADLSDGTDRNSGSKTILISSLYEGISNLKHEKDKDILQTVIIGGMSDEEYANSRGMDINALYRDKARARDRLIIEMVSTIQRKNKALVKDYSYLIDDDSRELVNDVIVREISFQDAATSRGLRVSDIQTKFTSAYTKIIKHYNSCRSDYLEELAKDDKKLMISYSKHLSRLSKIGATTEN